MDVKQRMHLTYTDNNTGKKKVVFVEAEGLEEANGDWVIYNKKTGKRLSPSKSWRKWLGAKAAASKIGGDAEVADAAWYQDNKDKLMGEATPKDYTQDSIWVST